MFVSGAAIIKGSKNLKEARSFLDFLISREAQRIFADVNYEYPLASGVKTNEEVLAALNCDKPSAMDCLSAMDVHLDQLGPVMEDTLDLLDLVDWY